MSKEDNKPEDALTSSEQELRLLVEAIPALVWRAGPEGSIEYVNKRVLDYLGAPLDEVIGWGWMDKVHPDDVAFKVRTWLQNLESGKPHAAACRFRGADGRYRWFEVRGEPVRASDGAVLGWYGVLIDIDDRRQAEESFRESEYKLRQIIETVPSLLWSLGPKGEQTQLNQRALDYIGVRYEELLHLGWTKFLHPDDLSETANAFNRAIQTGTSYQAVHRLRRADGEYRWHHARGEPLSDEQGRVIQWYGLTVDIDEGKRAEDKLRRSEAYLAEAQRLSHTGSFGWTPSTGELHWSDETFRILEYDPSIKPTIERVMQRIHPDDRAMMRQLIDETSSGKTDFDVTHRLLMPDGSIKFVHVLSHALKDAAGNLEVVGALMDVTENTCLYRDLAEREARLVERTAALCRSEAYLAEAQGLSRTGSAAYNDTTILYWSDETYRILGFDPRNGLPSREAVAQRIHPDDRERVSKEARRAECQKKDYKLEYRIVLPAGAIQNIELTAHPKFSASGELVEVVSTLIDVTERKRAEQALRDSEYELRQIIETVPGLIWSCGPDGEPTHINQRMLDFSGMRFEDFRLRGWEAFVHPDDFPQVTKAYYHAIESGTTYHGVLRLRRADGEFRWHHVRCEPLRDEQGRVIQWYGLSVEIDEAQLQAILNVLPAYTWYAAPRGALTFVNTRTADYLGIPNDHPLRFGIDVGAQWDHSFALLHPDDREDARKYWSSRLRTGEGGEHSYRVRSAQGDYRWFLTRMEPLRANDGTLLLWVGATLDIEELKCAEQALRRLTQELQRREAYLAEAQRLSQTGSWAWSPDQGIRYWSEECYRVLSFDPQDGLPRFEEFFQRIHPDDQPGFRERIQTAIRERAEWEADYRIVHLDGPVRDIHVVGHPVLSTSGHLVEFVGTVIDVTERRRAEQERARLRQLEADLAHINRVSALGELAASLAHEITQPIAAARNNARAALNFLDKEPPDLGEVREALGCVVGDADRSGVIVDRIRDHIKKAPPRKDRFDLNEAINEVIVLAQSAIAKNGISVQIRLTEGLAPVEGDRVQLQQVILNLILNATEAMSAVDEGARELLISTEQSRTNGVLVAVRDSGSGIDPENIEHVFDAFYTTKSIGMGMGLSICRSIIDAHGGRLWADANEPRGTVFQFTLPSPERSS
jgi:PAS domain S-box-containing protein